jgi:hypothetical protein
MELVGRRLADQQGDDGVEIAMLAAQFVQLTQQRIAIVHHRLKFTPDRGATRTPRRQAKPRS